MEEKVGDIVMNEAETALFTRLLDEAKELRTELEDRKRSERNYWEEYNKRVKMEKKLAKVEPLLTKKQKAKLEAQEE